MAEQKELIEGVRTLLHSSKLPEELWGEAANTVVYTTNRMISLRTKDKSRYELFRNEKPDVSNLRCFGQRAIVKEPENAREGKWAKKGEECRFVGYTERRNTYRFFTNTPIKQVFVSCDDVFLNDKIEMPTEREPTDGEVAIRILPSGGSKPSNENISVLRPADTSCDEIIIDPNTTDASSEVYGSAESLGPALTDSQEDEQQDETIRPVPQYERPVTRSRSKSVPSFDQVGGNTPHPQVQLMNQSKNWLFLH